ncbi:hypothetical protein CFIICLFH_5001 [Methylobacterium goesingense]|nr:hypothetical protein CFIICLFH_5001 [Methylobacterium goesingense]
MRRLLGAQPVEGGAERLDHREVVAHRASAEQVGLADPPLLQHRHEAAGVVFDMDPVALVQAVAVDGQSLALQRVQDHQRDELFGEVARAVIVRAVRHQHRQAVGLVPGPGEVVGGRLRGRVGRARVVAAFLGEEPVRRQRAVDLVGGDVQEAERRLSLARQPVPVSAGAIEHDLGADHVGADEGARVGDRAVDVTLGGQMHHRVGPERGVEGVHRLRIADVGLDEAVLRVVGQRLERDRVGRVGQRVQRRHLVSELLHQMQDQCRSDEAAAAGNQDAHGGRVSRGIGPGPRPG